VLGVAAAHATHSNVLVAGVAGLVAGAMSMAAGEYVSVLIPQSQRDAMEKIGGLQSLLSTNTLLKFASKQLLSKGKW
jgi:VIT1/CCC1 family predicted Fe2+/Mn2+ transporter